MPDLTGQMPSSLQAASRWQRIADVPVMLSHPDWESDARPPLMLWMHGRTVQKELDPGRYLRWIRAGIASCAIDLPGHGERFDQTLQSPERTLDIILQMAGELDDLVEALDEMDRFDMSRIGIGGMSAGGMVTLVRLCKTHPFCCASVEATTGSWQPQRERAMFHSLSDAAVDVHNPLTHLDTWREIPLQAFHSRLDEWVDYNGQQAFLQALSNTYQDPESVEFITYEDTGAPNEHAGFGRHAAAAKNTQRDFLVRHLID